MISPRKSVPRHGHGEREIIEDLIEAAMASDIAKVKSLLQAGADINSTDPESGYACLHIAAVNGDSELLDVLFAHHAQHGDLALDLETNDPPRKAWQLALSHGHIDIANTIDPLNMRQQSGSGMKPGP